MEEEEGGESTTKEGKIMGETGKASDGERGEGGGKRTTLIQFAARWERKEEGQTGYVEEKRERKPKKG